MKINKTAVLFGVLAMVVASTAFPAGIDAYVTGSVRDWYDIGVGSAGMIGALLLVFSFLLIKWVGVSWTLWIIGGMIGIGAIPLIVASTGLSMA